MADIVERLREVRGVLDNRWPGPTPMDLEAAEEIERLRNSHATLVKALEKIAAMDPQGTRADDLGRAARIAAKALARLVGRENAE